MPKTKLPYQQIDYIIIGSAIFLLLVSLLIITFNYSSLPDKIPAHYNFSGDVNRYDGKEVLWLLLLIFSVTNFGILKLARYTNLKNIRLNNEYLERRITLLAMPYLSLMGTLTIVLSILKAKNPNLSINFFIYFLVGITVVFLITIISLIYKNLPN